ncbi:MAG: hypothetical protein PHO32_10630 [Candidatus Cloacimonetes bacterium]|nr:hypothetical protein [Candidatus Cloacimonadota bacterium]
MRTLRIVITVLLLFVLTSCATLFTGTSENINMTSTPSDATVVVKETGGNEVGRGVTPTMFRLRKNSCYVVEISLEGYKTSKVYINNNDMNGVFFLDFICGGVLGMAIDYLTGSMWDLKPDSINVTLELATLNGKEQLYGVVKGMNANKEVSMVTVPMTPVRR